MADAIKVEGLSQFVRAVKKLDSDLPKMLRVAFNSAAQIVIDYAEPRIPHKTGAAAGTLKAKSTQNAVRVSAGGKRAPYYPWLDFGGQIGTKSGKAHGNRGKRPFYTDGRYLYPALGAKRDQLQAASIKALVDTANAAGLEVT